MSLALIAEGPIPPQINKEKISINNFPFELIFLIFGYLDPQALLRCCINSRWTWFSQDTYLWKNRFSIDFGKRMTKPKYQNIQWKDVYKKYHTNKQGLNFREQLNWGIKHKCISLFHQLIMSNTTFPLWNPVRDKTSSLVYIAAVRGLTEAVDILLSHGRCLPDETLPGDSTPLYVACQENHLPTVELLVKRGANLEFSFREGFTPLYVACQRGNLNIVKFLIQSGVNINASCVNGSTPLYIACQEGKVDTVKELITSGSVIEATFRRGFTSLYVASRNGHVETVKVLLDNGANVNARDDDGSTSVYVAAQNGHAKVVEVLLGAKANPDTEFLGGYTPLYVASQNGHHEVVSHLCKSPLVDINRKAPNGSPSLYIACQNGCVKVVEVLLEHGANISTSLSSGYSPLYIATHKGFYDIVKMLCEVEGIDLNFNNNSQPPALFAACYVGRLDILKLLLEKGADPLVSYTDKNVLHIAIELEDDETVMHLIDVAPELLFKPNKDGITPMEIAFSSSTKNGIKVVIREYLRLLDAKEKSLKKISNI